MYVVAETAEQAAELMTKASEENPGDDGECFEVSAEDLMSAEIGEVVFHPND